MTKLAIKVRSDDEWMVRAACLREDPELWYPNHSDDPGVLRVKLICRSCPVMQDCLRYALTHRERHGVWGGTTPDERDIILYGRRRPHQNWL